MIEVPVPVLQILPLWETEVEPRLFEICRDDSFRVCCVEFSVWVLVHSGGVRVIVFHRQTIRTTISTKIRENQQKQRS